MLKKLGSDSKWGIEYNDNTRYFTLYKLNRFKSKKGNAWYKFR